MEAESKSQLNYQSKEEKCKMIITELKINLELLLAFSKHKSINLRLKEETLGLIWIIEFSICLKTKK